jgi:peptide-methionine (S)-S-oxide reductase
MSETIVLGGGCFWCTEAIIKELRGVESVVPGYAGGLTENPTYEQLHDTNSGHAEVVMINFEPGLINLSELLEIFFAIHDPTTLNRQGNDVGVQYRSIILYANESQKVIAQNVIDDFAKTHWDDPVVTELKPLTKFWPAEDYHKDYFANNPDQAYCQLIINPKLIKFRQKFKEKLKSTR